MIFFLRLISKLYLQLYNYKMASLNEVYGDNFSHSIDYSHMPMCPQYSSMFGVCSCNPIQRKIWINNINQSNILPSKIKHSNILPSKINH